jgi:cytosine deaminase
MPAMSAVTQELASAGVPVALASDNTRDQFYAYGDLDMLEVFSQAGSTPVHEIDTNEEDKRGRP